MIVVYTSGKQQEEYTSVSLRGSYYIIGALTVGSSCLSDSVDDIFFLLVYGKDLFLLTHGAYPSLFLLHTLPIL